jgi:hypothetical protein
MLLQENKKEPMNSLFLDLLHEEINYNVEVAS